MAIDSKCMFHLSGSPGKTAHISVSQADERLFVVVVVLSLSGPYHTNLLTAAYLNTTYSN